MNFEEKLRQRISASRFQSEERRLLKVVLGEFQRQAVGKSISDESGYDVVRKMMKANEENLSCLADDDFRREGFLEENRIMSGLLPKYWDLDQIRANLDVDCIREAGSDGQAMGLAMRTLKNLNAPVQGEMVKVVVGEIRGS